MFDWNQYLIIARELATRGDEVSSRVAVSRAYYAAYWKARKFLEDNGERFDLEQRTHEAVWNLLYTDASSNGSNIGTEGHTLKKLRVRADYMDFRPVRQNDALMAIKTAELIIKDIEALRS